MSTNGVCGLCIGGKLFSGDGEEAPHAHLLGVCLLHSRHHVDRWLRRHRLRDAYRSFLHGLLYPRCSRKLPIATAIIVAGSAE